MRGAMPPLLNKSSWRGAQLKAQGQLYLTLPFTFTRSQNQLASREGVTVFQNVLLVSYHIFKLLSINAMCDIVCLS
jgi:hypothetical protein